MRRFSRFVSVVLAVCVAAGVAGCKPESEKASEALESTLQSYLADKSEIKDAESLPSPDYGDDETASILSAYQVDVDELHRRCFARYSFSIKDVKVSDDGGSATANVSITNVSLAAAAKNAASDYDSFAQTDEAQKAYASNGHTALLGKLFEFLYAHLESDELVTTDVELSLTKADDGSWTFDSNGNKAFYSALYGGSDVIDGLANVL